MGSRWRFWDTGKTKDGKPVEELKTTLSRLEKEGILRVLTTDVLEHRVQNLYQGLASALKTFRKGSSMEVIPEHLLKKLPEKERTKHIKKAITGIQQKREALDSIVLLLTNSAWPWNRAGDKHNRLMAFIVDEFLQDYEELKDSPEYYDDLYTMALSIIQKSFMGEDVTKEVPIAIFMPQAGKGYDPGVMEHIAKGNEGEK